MKILAIIQARMGSTRLPGKMLKEIKGKPIVYYVLNQARKSKLIDEIVLATTNNDSDKILIQTVEKLGFKTFSGSENDVLDRYYQAAKAFHGDIVVRITGDCPLIDPSVIDHVIKLFLDQKCDYSSNINPPTFPDGLDVEVFSFEALEKSWNEAKLNSEREHVTPYIKNNPNKFRLVNFKNEKDLSSMRWVIDEKDDFEFINQIIEKLRDHEIKIDNILKVLQRNPNISNINRKFNRNEGYQKSLEEDKK